MRLFLSVIKIFYYNYICLIIIVLLIGCLRKPAVIQHHTVSSYIKHKYTKSYLQILYIRTYIHIYRITINMVLPRYLDPLDFLDGIFLFLSSTCVVFAVYIAFPLFLFSPSDCFLPIDCFIPRGCFFPRD